jgi:predicted component of type VI protein secretion system
MNSLLEKIDKENDPVALHEAVSILNSLSAQKEYQELVHATVVNLRKILWPTQQDPTLYETPVKNYPKALQDLLTLGLNKFEKAQDNQAQASS